jgi:hypothetical protein
MTASILVEAIGHEYQHKGRAYDPRNPVISQIQTQRAIQGRTALRRTIETKRTTGSVLEKI